MKKLFVVFFLAILVLSVIPVQGEAQGFVTCGLSENNPKTDIDETVPCGFCDIFVLVSNIIRFFLVPTNANNYIAIVPVLATLFFIIGGFFLLTGGASPGEILQGGGKGDPAGLKKGRSILLSTVVGLIIVYGSWIFLTFIFDAFATVEWSNWGQIVC